jgi:type IV fimbrial biogenesis protein FimT
MIRQARHLLASRGITAIELLTVVAVLAILAAVGIPSFQDFTDKRRLEGAAHQYASHLQWARSQAVQTGQGVRVKAESADAGACYAIYRSGDGTCSCLGSGSVCDNGQPPLLVTHFAPDARVTISNHGTAERRIDPMRGTFTPTGTVAFSTPRGHTVHAITNLMGRTRLCTPGQRFGGLPSC